MGMYTELVLGVEINSKDENLINLLSDMCNGEADENKYGFTHELFKTDRWNYMFTSGSYYFNGQNHREFKYDSITKSYFLTLRFNMKNYDDEIQKFLDFIRPYCDDRGYVGYMRYEEQEDPTLIYFTDDGVRYMEVLK